MTAPAHQDFPIRRGSAGDYAAVIFAILQADGVTPIALNARQLFIVKA